MRKSLLRSPRKLLAGMLGCGVAALMLLGGQSAQTPAQALDLPTWDDVQAAKQNEALAAKKVTEINHLIALGEKKLDRLRSESEQANASWQETEALAQSAAKKAETLKSEAEKSRKEADEAADQAAVIVAQMYRSGGVDRNIELFLESKGEEADALLERLAAMSKATERNTLISDQAEQAKNSASSLGKQAHQAQKERERLNAEAEKKAVVAARAAETQRQKIESQEKQQRELQAQLAALEDETTDTVDGYRERVRIEKEREAARKAEEERQRKKAEELERQRQQENPGVPVVPTNTSSWLRPTGGWVSTYFYQVPGHTGVDLAIGCGTPIIAPQPGTVTFVGWKDGMGGNMVHVDHAGGFQTRYAHLSAFGPAWGSWVPQGAIVGYVGTTGMSFGCHLHYEVLLNGIFQNPIPNYGVTG